MANEIYVKSSTTQIGKGKTKKDVVEVAFAYDLEASEASLIESGATSQYVYDTGSSVDDPYGLMLVRMEMFTSMRVASDFAVQVNGYMFATEHLDDSDKWVSQKEHALVDNVLVAFPRAFSSTLGNVYHTIRNYSELDFRKIMVGNSLGLNTSQGISTPDSEGGTSEVTFAYKYVFQKMKMTKSEYLEKFATRVCM